jgi:hypothetical protein
VPYTTLPFSERRFPARLCGTMAPWGFYVQTEFPEAV